MNHHELKQLIRVARGQAPADLVLANGRIINTFNGDVEAGNVAIYRGRIAGIGDYTEAAQTVDLAGRYVAPGLINGHTHVESSMLHITQYARAVVPRGTAAVVTDLHEITNVCGLAGARQVLRIAEGLPLDVFFMVPSCVPATLLESSGARVTAGDVQYALGWKNSIGLGEVMDFPAVLQGHSGMLLKLALARGRAIDGHAVGLHGRDLNAYLAGGIASDHECTTLEEAEEKLARGMWIMIREGSSEKNLADLLPIVNDRTFHRCLLVVDDRSCGDLLRDGDIDGVVRKAIRLGLDPVRAIQMATINPAQYFHLDGLGAVAPGYHANLMVFSSLGDLDTSMVFHRGQAVARDGQALFPIAAGGHDLLTGTVKVGPLQVSALRIPAERSGQPIIEVVPGQITTIKSNAEARVRDGAVVTDVDRDILKLAVVERHSGSGRTAAALVKGFGLKRGALASSIAHDAHNIVAVGVEDEDLLAAVREVERLQGGLVAVAEGRVLSSLPLPVAGLLSDAPLEAVVEQLGRSGGCRRGAGMHPGFAFQHALLPGPAGHPAAAADGPGVGGCGPFRAAVVHRGAASARRLLLADFGGQPVQGRRPGFEGADVHAGEPSDGPHHDVDHAPGPHHGRGLDDGHYGLGVGLYRLQGRRRHVGVGGVEQEAVRLRHTAPHLDQLQDLPLIVHVGGVHHDDGRPPVGDLLESLFHSGPSLYPPGEFAGRILHRLGQGLCPPDPDRPEYSIYRCEGQGAPGIGVAEPER